MSRETIQRRRLELPGALHATLRALPRLWTGAFGALGLCAVAWLTPQVQELSGWGLAAWSVAAGLTSLVAVGALARLSITDDLDAARALGLGRAGLQMGRPELRLLGAGLLSLIFVAMIVIVLALVVLAIFGTAELDVTAIQARDWGRVGDTWKLGLLAVLAAVAVMVPLFLTVRLALFIPATIGRHQMVSLTAMSLPAGSVGLLFVGLVFTALPKIVLLILVGSGIISGPVLAVIAILILVGLQASLTIGFLGAAYRQLETWTSSEPKA